MESHADARGSDKYNMDLCKRRAASTVDYLVENGIDKGRLISEGYGESRPVNDCTEPNMCTEEQYAKNVEVYSVVSNRDGSMKEDTNMEDSDSEDSNMDDKNR